LRRSLVISSLFLLVVLPGTNGGVRTTTSTSGDLPKYIDEYPVPTAQAAPLAITVDTHGIVWFTESNISKLGRFDPSTDSFSEYSVPGVGDMWGIAIDREGYVWFAQYSGRGSVNPGGEILAGGQGRLGRFDPATGNLSFVDIPTIGSFPMRLVVDQRNRIWFTELLGNRTGVYDQATEKLTEYEVSTTLSGPADLTFDRKGVLWFTETFAQKLVEFFPQNQTRREYSFGSNVFAPVGVAVGDNGHVWIADHGGNWIVEFDPQTQELTRYPTQMLRNDLSIPNGLLIDGKGRIWFSEHVGNAIGYFDPQTQVMTEFQIPTGPISTALWIAPAPNGDVWFTEWSTNKIGVVHANLPVPLSIQPSHSQLQLQVGQETSVNLRIRSSQGIGGNGTLQYSLGSYNPADVSATFSPQILSLSELVDFTALAEVKMSATAKLGNYTLGLGIDAGAIKVWSMLKVQTLQQSIRPPIQAPSLFLALAGLLVAALVILLSHRKIRKKPSI
jgi:virginiamycin B lyase